jgi:hypothetical protein
MTAAGRAVERRLGALHSSMKRPDGSLGGYPQLLDMVEKLRPSAGPISHQSTEPSRGAAAVQFGLVRSLRGAGR